jgi:succinyl-CoA synthetase beta subunit
MNFEEHAGKALLRQGGIEVPRAELAASPEEAERIALAIAPCVVKPQIPAGGRGKAGGIGFAATPVEARQHALRLLGMEIAGHRVARVLIEERVAVAAELYAAVVNDAGSRGPLLLFAAHGGIDVEEIAARHPEALVRLAIDIRRGLEPQALEQALPRRLPCARSALIDALLALYGVYAANDAELLEINPLAVARDGGLLALDCKFVMDDSAVPRHEALAKRGARERLTPLEERARAQGLRFIELDGDVGVLANGAGLAMTTMDAVRYYGGAPANFVEIGGDAYTKAAEALRLVLANARVKSLLVNFCGAFARTDVMVKDLIMAWQQLKPNIPVFFTVHGTGEEEAVALIEAHFNAAPFAVMDDAVQAAVAAAQRARS